MRFSTTLDESEQPRAADASAESRGVTLDVMMGVVAGIVLVFAIMLMASAGTAPTGI